jgi:uncharacterized protein
VPILPSPFCPPLPLRQADVQTFLPYLFRRPARFSGQRERMFLSDGDFLDLDWTRTGARRLAILSHGLEGSSASTYILGCAAHLHRRGWDTLAWNFRGCSGDLQSLKTGYHSGKWDDLAHVVRAASQRGYDRIALVGFSVGGNITMLYLARCQTLPSQVRAAVTVSVPCDLAASAGAMARRRSTVYMRWFLSLLRTKMIARGRLIPGSDNDKHFRRFTTFREFDDVYTAVEFGYRNAQAYWSENSSASTLGAIPVPTLLLTSLDDPFLAPECFPFEAARHSKELYLEASRYGGHVGFVSSYRLAVTYADHRIAAFLDAYST